MIRNIVWAFLCLLLFHSTSLSQDNALYKEVDDYVLHIPLNVSNPYDLKMLQREIKNKFKEETQLARAAYVWIANNISYDCVGYRNGNGLYMTEEVLAQKKSICEGYAILFKNFCDAFELNCHIVHGYAEIDKYPKHDTTYPGANHAWNAVAIHGRWKLVDVTWGSGSCYASLCCFEKQFSEQYFFADPLQMIETHFPGEQSWQLLDSSYNFEAFRINRRSKGLEQTLVKDSIINKSAGDTIRFIYYTKRDTLNTISIISGAPKEVYFFGKLVAFDKGYYYDYKITEAGRYFIYVSYFNDRNSKTTATGNRMETYLLRVEPEKIKIVNDRLK